MHGQSCCFYETYFVLDISFAVAIIVCKVAIRGKGIRISPSF